jgi:hypothetical protein
LEQVFFTVGKFDDGSPRLQRAPMDVLQWASVPGGHVSEYIIPLGTERVSSADVNDPLSSDTRAAVDVGQEFGFYTGKAHVIDMVSGNGKDMFGVTRLGPI